MPVIDGGLELLAPLTLLGFISFGGLTSLGRSLPLASADLVVQPLLLLVGDMLASMQSPSSQPVLTGMVAAASLSWRRVSMTYPLSMIVAK